MGKNYPTIDRLGKMAEALNIPLASFFDFSHLKDNNERAAGIEEMLRKGYAMSDQILLLNSATDMI